MKAPIYLCGSTASGKSNFALALAESLNAEIVNADAYQIYRGLEILSAAPNAEELKRVPHHLYSAVDCSESMDAQKFRSLALERITSIQEKGKQALVVGGSGMYLKFLTHGASPVPAGDADLRAALEERTLVSLIDELKSLDPQGAEETNLKNRRYVIRALEICLLSGQPMSAIKQDWKNQCQLKEKKLKGYVLQWDVEVLRQRIFLRTEQMLNQGAIEEVQALKNPSATCIKAIGIEPIQQFLAGKIDRDRCAELIFFATCQYAKRQRTWFKKEQWLRALSRNEQTNVNELVTKVRQDLTFS